MLLALGLCAAGLLVLVAGAELVVRGGGAFAGRLKVPPVVIGLTIVAVGTSTPELAVGIDASMQGNGTLAVGNIAGTNTVNLLLILGLSALLMPIELKLQTIRMELPAMLAAALIMAALSLDGVLSRLDGAILVGTGIVYTFAVIQSAQRESRAIRLKFAEEFGVQSSDPDAKLAAARELAQLLAGIVVIVIAADWLVDGAVSLARIWNVSDAFIGLTFVAIGTSAPELATTILSTMKGERDIAIGNLLGSSIYNIAFILGLTCLAPANGVPVPVELIFVDIPVMVLVVIACVPVFLSGSRISRLEGGIFVCAYALYLGYLILDRT